MQFITKIRDWGRRLMDRTASATGIARTYKTIFDLGGVPAFAQFYDVGIFIWKWLYHNLAPSWL